MSATSIEWTELTWNPVTGCNKVSAGCKYCYAERMSKRLHAMGVSKYRNQFKVTLHHDELGTPYKWKTPKMVFVNSMSDLFHPDVPVTFIRKVFDVMKDTPQHTYQILTKRSERLLKLSSDLNWSNNIWMGVSVENEKVSHRILDLTNSAAKVKFLSIEPLIGPIKNLWLDGINWVIVGGESGPKARPIKLEWIDHIKNECQRNQVSFFFKQWGKGEFNHDQSDPTLSKKHPQYAKGGCQLNGKLYREMPNLTFA